MVIRGVPKSIFNRVNSGLRQVRNRDYLLLENRVHEQTLTGKLAHYLQHEFPDHNVDIEYNKHFDHPKLYGYFVEDDEARPDIIVHQRGSDEENLLVIEVKKRGVESSNDDMDIMKLEGLTKKATRDHHFFGYSFGLFIDFIDLNEISLRWVVGGTELANQDRMVARLDSGGFYEYSILESRQPTSL